ncbi:MAG: hypothetical protein HC850_16565 [Rhodomicrobium sp.]|nr:hypothetical protein [Rhodomicrobium sp.]
MSGLKAKREEIKRAILDHQRKIKAARADLEAINQALAVFGEYSGNPKTYFKRDQIFERGELFRVLFDALRNAAGPLSTTDLATIAMQSKRLDRANRELVLRVSHSVGIALNRYRNRGQIVSDGFAGKVRRWRLAT